MGYNSGMNSNTKSNFVDERVIGAVRRVLEERMGRFGFVNARVISGEDHDGDAVLFIEVDYRLSDEPIDTKATFGLVQALREALGAVGETRFPHVRHHFDEKQKVAQKS